MKRRKIDRLCALGLIVSAGLTLPMKAVAAHAVQGIAQAEKTLTVKGQVVDQMLVKMQQLCNLCITNLRHIL